MSNSRADRTSYELRPCPRQDYSERRYRELQIGHELTTTEDLDISSQLTPGSEIIVGEMEQLAEAIYCRTCAIPEGARTASRRATGTRGRRATQSSRATTTIPEGARRALRRATSTRGRRATQSSRATTRIPEGTGAAKRGKTKTRRRRATQAGGASKGIAGATSTPTGGRVGGCKRSS